MCDELIKQLRYLSEKKTKKARVKKCEANFCYEKVADASWCIYEALNQAANAIERLVNDTEYYKRFAQIAEAQDKRIDELYEALEAEKNKSISWISVNDRLPEINGTYLVYAPTYSGGSSSGLDNICGVMFARWKKRWSIEVGYYERPNCVTHWMPLPEPPKEATHD